ncbi:glycosyl transferase [Actinoplanes sp. SE50]|uniref:glycosyltransferase family 2 protein n=1 Tax=unclassified Actinoplanes TaxID=2626549 RepID=UPI00023EBEC5|nr:MULTISPECIES: glycosyltransferase family 2 protein [unclassified Actinoplanes]AEV82947.1 Amylovoran biosynthesis glycosyltransferase amsB [Actinoplanes sp. SE50/110]ATO81343.1 glycosyl transferase [Actinoplanes sp. SE50]SLL98750.1 glycosyl transferase [Actinoplanes sp. SE50/110]
MSSEPDVSVVIPTCNRPELAVRAVRSALGQTHQNLEVIVVVDGPDEATVAALDEIGDSRLRVIVLPERGKAPNARNTGARNARGRWTAMLDDDDEWLPAKIERQLALATAATSERPVIACRMISRTPRADNVMPRRLPEPGEPISEYLVVRRGLFYGDGFVQTSCIMAPTELWLKVPFTVGLRRQQELDWTLRALREPGTELVYAAEPLVLWHQDENRERISLENPWQEQLDWLRANRELFTPRAYAAFTLSVLSSMAAPTRNAKLFRELLAEARGHGRPGAVDYLTHMQIWALPPSMRHRLRDLVVGRKAPEQPVATDGN